MLTVLHAVNTLGVGGAENRLVSLVEGCGTQCEHHVAYLGGPDTLAPALRTAGAAVHCLNVTRKSELQGAVASLIQVLRKHRIDLVDTHTVHAAVVARSAAAATKTPVCMTQHHAFHPKQESLWYRRERESRDDVRIAIAISHAVRRELVRVGFRAPISVIPTGIDSERQRLSGCGAPSWPVPYILMVGQFRDQQKGHDLLLKALATLRVRNIHPVALLVGDGQRRPAVQTLASDLQLEHVHFLGERLDVANLMSHCQLLVVPSRWEGFGRVLIEGLASGACIVASRVEAVPEIVDDGVNGVLVPPEDPEMLAQAIGRLLSDSDRRATFATQGRRIVSQEFALSRMCRSTIDTYEAAARD